MKAHSCYFYFNSTLLKVLATASKQEKEIQGIQILKINKVSDDMILYVENSKDVTTTKTDRTNT